MLSLFRNSGGIGEISDDGSFDNPIVFSVPAGGGTIQGKYFLRMDTPSSETCTEGRVFCIDNLGTDESTWIEFAEDIGDAPGEYDDELLFELDEGQELAVWIKLNAPSGLDSDPKEDLRVSATYIRHEI